MSKQLSLSLPCCRCGKPGAPHSEHHQRKGSGPTGKGMGGMHEHLAHVVCCQGCHRALHESEWGLRVEGQFYLGHERAGGEWRSPVKYNDRAADPRYWTEQALRNGWEHAEEAAMDCYRQQCAIAWALHERMGHLPEWWIEAAHLLSRNSERVVWWQRVYERCKTYEIALRDGWTDNDWGRLALLPQRAITAVLKQPDSREALEEAAHAYMEGATANEIARALRGDSDVSEKEYHACPDCGARHQIKALTLHEG